MLMGDKLNLEISIFLNPCIINHLNPIYLDIKRMDYNLLSCKRKAIFIFINLKALAILNL